MRHLHKLSVTAFDNRHTANSVSSYLLSIRLRSAGVDPKELCEYIHMSLRNTQRYVYDKHRGQICISTLHQCLNFINVPLPKDLAYKILNGEKLAEKELLDSLKPNPKSDYEQAQELLNQINNAQQLIDNELADHKPEPTNLREKLERLKESNIPPNATAEPTETLSQKLERLKQKKAEKPKPQSDNDNDYSPF